MTEINPVKLDGNFISIRVIEDGIARNRVFLLAYHNGAKHWVEAPSHRWVTEKFVEQTYCPSCGKSWLEHVQNKDACILSR